MGDTGDRIKGRVKQAAGDLTDNDEMKREGKRDEMAGDVKEKAESAIDAVRDKVNDAKR